MTYMYPFKGFSPDLPKIVSGKGIWLKDENGKEYLDSTAGPMTVNLGHCHPNITKVISEQVNKLHFAYRHHFRSSEPEKLSEKLITLSNDNKSHAFFLNGGSEASEAAYRIALDYFQRQGKPKKVIALGRYISNHGNTIKSLTYGDDRARKNNLLGRAIDLEESNLRLPACYSLHCTDALKDSYYLECLNKTFEIIDEIGPERIACVFAEPMTASSGGAIVPHPDYFKGLKAGLVERDILLIVDEIVTGLGRTGQWFNMHYWGVDSDITVIGKGLGSGFTPISGVLVSRTIAESMMTEPMPHFVGHTYSGNPLSTTIGFHVLETIEHEIGLDNIRHRGDYLGQLLKERLSTFEEVVDIRGMGLLWAVETNRSNTLAQKYIQLGHMEGINLYPCRSSGADGNALTFLLCPPLVISKEDIELMVERLSRVMDAAHE